MTTLYIAEKPSLAEAIVAGLGGVAKRNNGYWVVGDNIVTNCFGHMLETYDPEDYDSRYKKWNFDDLPIPSTYPPKMKVKKSCAAQVKIIKDLIKQADTVVNAGDADDEGQILVDEILGYFGWSGPTYRVLISDLNVSAVKREIAKIKSQPNENYKSMGLSALARSIGDKCYGYNLTRAYTLKAREAGHNTIFHIGRVQSAVLGLINMRTLANLNHTESYYYNVTAAFEDFNAKYSVNDSDITDEKNRIIDQANALQIQSECEGKSAQVTVVETNDVKRQPPLPFNLSSLQQTCAKKFGYKSKDTLDIAQALYEKHKLLTYPRSDCRYLSDEHYSNSSAILDAVIAGCDELSNVCVDRNLKHSAFNNDKITAHHAIIPTEKTPAWELLNAKEKNVYAVVARAFVAMFYPQSIREKTSIEIAVNNTDRVFKTSKSTLKSIGWEALFGSDIDSDDDDCLDNNLKRYAVDDSVVCSKIAISKAKTKPQKFFTEATLLQAMTSAGRYCSDKALRKALEDKDKGNSSENGSIGTEATRAGILEQISKQTDLVEIVSEPGYSQKVYKTTKLGREFCALLPESITRPDISAQWSVMQSEIRDGKSNITDFIKTVDNYVSQQIKDLAKNGVNIKANLHKCPNCANGHLLRLNGQNGLFWGCNQFRNGCKTALPDFNGKPKIAAAKTKAVASKHKCPKCSKSLVKRQSEKVAFWGCSGFPDCKTIIFDKSGVPDFEKYELRKVSA